jgi:hypothetical protein
VPLDPATLTLSQLPPNLAAHQVDLQLLTVTKRHNVLALHSRRFIVLFSHLAMCRVRQRGCLLLTDVASKAATSPSRLEWAVESHSLTGRPTRSASAANTASAARGQHAARFVGGGGCIRHNISTNGASPCSSRVHVASSAAVAPPAALPAAWLGLGAAP